MKQWEHYKEYYPASVCLDIDYEINRMGERGWQAWHLEKSYDRDSGKYSYAVYFKREIELDGDKNERE